METIRIAMECVIAFFAVIGLYDSIRWLMGKLFGSQRLIVALEILTQRDAESAESLIRDALSHYPSFPSGRMIVLIAPPLADHPTLMRALQVYGLTGYVMETDGET